MTSPDLPPFVRPLLAPGADDTDPLEMTTEARTDLDRSLDEIAEARARVVSTAQRAVVWR